MASKKKKKHQAAGRVPTGLAPIAPGTRGISRIPLSAVLARNLFPYPLPLSSSPTTVSTPVSLLSQRMYLCSSTTTDFGWIPRSPSHMPTRLISPLVHFPSAGNSGSVSQIPSNRDTIKKESTSFFCVCVGVFPCFRHQPSSLETLVCLPSDKQSTARARPDATWSSAAPPSDPSDSGLGAAKSHACQPACHSLPDSVSSDRLHD